VPLDVFTEGAGVRVALGASHHLTLVRLRILVRLLVLGAVGRVGELLAAVELGRVLAAEGFLARV
jgi:hypothetical protein